MSIDFDRVIDRRSSDSIRWRYYDADVLPMWVADMDFLSPQPVIDALRARVDQGIFGYAAEPEHLREVIAGRLAARYHWHITPEQILFVPGIVSGLNLVSRSLVQPGGEVLVQTPVYPPILSAPLHAGLTRGEMELTRGEDGRYCIDFDAFERAINERTRLFMLCNPHNPVGRVFSAEELAEMARICRKHDVFICSDEIHSDLVFSGSSHIPIASLSDDIAQHTVTLLAPSKTYNVPGLACSVVVAQNPQLREAIQRAAQGIIPHVNIMGYVAALAAYSDGDPWLAECLEYLETNRDFVSQTVADRMPGITSTPMEGTYLAWFDCRQSGIRGTPCEFFLKEARVGLNDGASFGKGGEGFVRFNFASPRSVVAEALDRMVRALEKA